ncbi:MAG: hypothetical protein CO108_10810 [Deltaproteobacteria bacterium CG_4_9_14_3_um_filter_63_12]|nr:MAG: hypothetical protein CO108_10810 [Deltaproteobacteria bacterium CG_4_9_14_3_um_filter_63_12]
MMNLNVWEQWKKGYYTWEAATAQLIEQWIRSPLVLGPSGAMLSAMMKVKAKRNEKLAETWGNLGLPTKRDQERSLHLLNQLHSRISDLEERIESLQK